MKNKEILICLDQLKKDVLNDEPIRIIINGIGALDNLVRGSYESILASSTSRKESVKSFLSNLPTREEIDKIKQSNISREEAYCGR